MRIKLMVLVRKESVALSGLPKAISGILYVAEHEAISEFAKLVKRQDIVGPDEIFFDLAEIVPDGVRIAT